MTAGSHFFACAVSYIAVLLRSHDDDKKLAEGDILLIFASKIANAANAGGQGMCTAKFPSTSQTKEGHHALRLNKMGEWGDHLRTIDRHKDGHDWRVESTTSSTAMHVVTTTR